MHSVPLWIHWFSFYMTGLAFTLLVFFPGCSLNLLLYFTNTPQLGKLRLKWSLTFLTYFRSSIHTEHHSLGLNGLWARAQSTAYSGLSPFRSVRVSECSFILLYEIKSHSCSFSTTPHQLLLKTVLLVVFVGFWFCFVFMTRIFTTSAEPLKD